MKYSVLPRMQETGTLREVNLAVVNVDEEDALASQLMRGGTIPQLIVYNRTASGWHREQITGAASEAAVEGLLRRAQEARQASLAGRSGNSASGGN
jgi:hypothetical protein